MRTLACFVPAILLGLVLLSGCHTSSSPPAPLTGGDSDTPDPKTAWALVRRAFDDAGLSRQDKHALISPDEIAQLKSFFPELTTTATSNIHGGWTPLVVVQFHAPNAPDVFVVTDYRLYRIGDSSRGDFVVRPGFPDYVQRLFMPTGAP